MGKEEPRNEPRDQTPPIEVRDRADARRRKRGGGGRDGGPVVSAPIASSRLLFVAHAKETKQAKNKRRSRKPSRFWGLGYVTNFWLGLFLISVPHRHRVSRSTIFHNPK